MTPSTRPFREIIRNPGNSKRKNLFLLCVLTRPPINATEKLEGLDKRHKFIKAMEKWRWGIQAIGLVSPAQNIEKLSFELEFFGSSFHSELNMVNLWYRAASASFRPLRSCVWMEHTFISISVQVNIIKKDGLRAHTASQVKHIWNVCLSVLSMSLFPCHKHSYPRGDCKRRQVSSRFQHY